MPDAHVLPELLTPTEAMQLLRVSRSWLYEAAKDGRIPAIRLGGGDGPVRFVRADLLAHIEAARRQWHPARTSAAALKSSGGSVSLAEQGERRVGPAPLERAPRVVAGRRSRPTPPRSPESSAPAGGR